MSSARTAAQLPLFDAADAAPTPLPPAAAAVGVTRADPSPGAVEAVPIASTSAGSQRSDQPRPHPRPTAETSIVEAAGAFDDHLIRDAKTLNTRRAFASDLRLLAQHLGAGCAVGTITTDALEAFLVWMAAYRGEPCSPKTYVRRVTTLKVFFGWLHATQAIPGDPALALVHRHAEPPLPGVLSDGEVERLLAEAHARWNGRAADPRPALVVRLLLDTGLKKGELVRLRSTDVAADADSPSLLVRYDNPRWREKERRVPFGPGVKPLLSAYVARYRPADVLFPCTARNLEYILTDLIEAARLPGTTHFETLRWTCALRACRAGVDPETLRADLGLSPITWADTQRKLLLLDDGSGRGERVGRFFGVPGTAAD